MEDPPEGSKEDDLTTKIVSDDKIKCEPTEFIVDEIANQEQYLKNQPVFNEENDIKTEENGVQELKTDVKNDSSTSIYDTSAVEKEPLFAEICSFFNYFAAYLNMKPLSFVKLEKMFCSINDEVNHDLIDLHLTLLRKIGYKSARFDKWETFLQKFLLFNKAEDESILLERRGYANLSLTTKLEILFQLCGRQFDFNLKFKENIYNTCNPSELRLAPIGKDRNGLSYWFQRDHDLNVRVYTEEPEDESGGTWSLITRSHSGIVKLIESLKRTDFGTTIDENDEDIDEKEALELSTDSKKSQQSNGTKKRGDELSPGFWKILKPEVAQKYYNYLAKRNTFQDVSRDGSDLNKRKNEKLQKKEAKTNAPTTLSQTSAPTKPDKRKSDENEEPEKPEEEEPEIPPELLEDRRVLPRRSARSNAISNIKTITTPSRSKKPAVIEEKKKEETEDESDDDEEINEDDDDESDQSLGASDEEFNLPSKKGKGRSKKHRRRPMNDDDDTPKPKKKKKKVTTIAFEESSEEEEEQQEIKEKRKATALTLCMQCHKSSKPEVLLLCDMCDDAWHTFCLKPSLWYVPDDDWFCPTCHHAMLVDRLIKVEEELKEALKVKETEEAKKKTAAERLKREMEYIGVSLNNIIPSASVSKQDPYQTLSESTESEDDGQRKSKKKAMKRVMRHSQPKKEKYYGPVITVAEGRSRRSTKKVDYNFSAYDEQLQEAMDVIDEPAAKIKYENDHRPTGGLGRGKDMANIAEAQRKRSHDSEDFEDENNEPIKKQRKSKSKKLTDLDIDNATESEDDEYRASDAEEEPEPSEDDYVPSDIERKERRSGRRRSDEEFIDDGASDSDYNPSGRRKKGRQSFVKRRSGGRRKRKHGLDSDDDESDEPEYQSESSDDGYQKKKKPSKPSPSKKQRRKNESDEDDEEVGDYLGESSDSGPKKKTARGRPMRKAAAKAVLKESDDEEMDDDDEVKTNKKGESRPIGALTRKLDEDEFKPEDDGEEEDDDEEIDDEKEDVSDTGEEEDEKVPTIVPPKRRAPTPPPVVAKKAKKEVLADSEKEAEKASVPSKVSTSESSAPATEIPAPLTPITSATPPRQQILEAPTPQPAEQLMNQVPMTSTPMIQSLPIRSPHPSNVFTNYSVPMSHPNAVRFSVPQSHQIYGAPPNFYGAPPMNYGHPGTQPMMPTYVMQPPTPQVGYGPGLSHHDFPSSNLTVLESLQPMHPSPYGLQPIHLSQPSDSDGLAQAITGAMNTDL